jgi:ABC-2 type transport system permease protein
MLSIIKSIKVFKEYLYLLQQLVSRDFKIKYKRSVLGVLWSVLNPLFTMMILYVVFSAFFASGGSSKSGGITNYSIYLLSGIVIYNFFAESTNLAIGAVVGNFNLLTKVYMPKYVFPLSKVLSSSLNLVFSVLALYMIDIVQAALGWVPFTWANLLMPYDLVCLIIFCIGMGLVLSCITVFFRDMFYIWGVMLTAWMYITPIMYPLSLVEQAHFSFSHIVVIIMKINPLYQFINYARTILLNGQVPTLGQHIYVFAWAVVMLVVGLIIFRSKQDKFIYYI